jgi:hypothetical protein
VLGWEDGYWYNESIDVDQSDGLSAAEREAFVARTMARVEYLRGLEYTDTVPVSVVSRAEYRETTPFSPNTSEWDEQSWEALFLVGEETTVDGTLGALYGSNVFGFYSPREERIVVVSDSSRPALSRATLAHELVHALQDQQFGLPPGRPTRDGALARNGLVEGDARLVEQLYQRNCRDGTWECVAGGGGGSGGPPANPGVLRSILQPYSDGPTLVAHLREQGGWAAVNDAYDAVPASTEQVIHPEKYPDEQPRAVAVPDRSNSQWGPVDHEPRANTLGEASLYVMLLSTHVIREREFESGTGPYSYFNYSHPRTDGWGGDSLVPYTDGTDAGYVWAIEWDTEADAEQFASSYRLLLRLEFGAVRVDDGVYVVRDGPYADAFRLTRTGDRVVVVNAPTAEDLPAVHRPQ